jgi:hypothetical protein
MIIFYLDIICYKLLEKPRRNNSGIPNIKVCRREPEHEKLTIRLRRVRLLGEVVTLIYSQHGKSIQ